MSTLNERLLDGIHRLLEKLGPQHSDYMETLIFQGRIAKVLSDEERYGPTEVNRSELNRVIEGLNRLCLKNLDGMTFNELCGVSIPRIASASGKRFLSGAVLYANVAGYSQLPRRDQEAAMSFLGQEVEELLTRIERRVWLDFRDGEILLFLDSAGDQSRDSVLMKTFLFGLRLQLRTSGKSFKVGATIHWEDGATFRYINDKSNLVGHGLSEAQLLMSFSDGEHFFISINAFETLRVDLEQSEPAFGDLLTAMLASGEFNTIWQQLPLPGDYRHHEYGCKKFTFHDRHKRQRTLYNFCIIEPGGKTIVGSPSLPYHQVPIEFRDEPTLDPHQAFIQRLVESDTVSIVGLTHESLAKFLQKSLEIRQQQNKGFWKDLQIIFPSQSILEKLFEEKSTTQVRIARWEGGKRSVFQFLLAQHALDHWECLEFDGNLPFVGNWFIGRRNTSIRVAPILPGCDMKKTYYMEFFDGMPAYDQLAQAFGVIYEQSTRIVEWDIYGKRNEAGDFCIQGLVSRKRRDELGQQGRFCFPVVLIMLHADTDGGHKSILQERTIYNSSSDFGCFSNISGRVTDTDVYVTKGLHPYVNFGEDASIPANELMSRTRLKRGDPLPPETWKAAAAREIQEEIGLSINPDRLEPHCSFYLERSDGDLLFKIFSLKLERTASADEWRTIRDVRPNAELSAFGLNQLRQFHTSKKFNKLLQKQFDEIFVPIFQKLGIDE